MKRPGFTFLQLLLALFLLTLLAAATFPVFIRARGPIPRMPVCLANLKHLSLGFILYAEDYDGRLPIYDVKRVDVTKSGSLTFTHWAQAMQLYSLNVQEFQCPYESKKLGTDYFYNRRVSGKDTATFKNSATYVLLTEGIDTANCSQATATAPIVAGTPPAYSRHLGGSFYAFGDGHIKWLRSSRAPSSTATSGGGFTFIP